jgi:CheY-like chemotaxis protein
VLLVEDNPVNREVAVAIRARETESGGSRRVPIIALTASALATDRARALGSGMDEHLAKPFTPGDLRRTLDRWLAPPGEPGPEPNAPVEVATTAR